MAVLRHRALILFLICVIFTSLCIFILPSKRTVSLHRIVQETHQKLSNVIQSSDIKRDPTPLLSAHPSLLTKLGLLDTPTTTPTSAPLPLVTAVGPGQAELVLGWLRSVHHWLQAVTNLQVIVWDLGLGRYDKEALVKQCNITSPQCSIVQFDWAGWPSHIREPKFHCHRPIIIQTTLRDQGSLVWLDINYRLTESDLSSWLRQAETHSVLAWSEPEPAAGPNMAMATTALTHPKMFGFFDKRKYEDYAFQHMVGLGGLILYNSEMVRSKLMLPWLQCVLTESCVNPIGAQDTGCRFDKKPQFRYSGCHRYDLSALNIVLGEMFNFQESLYIGDSSFFRKVDQDVVKDLDMMSGNTSTSLSSENLSGLEM